MNIRLHHHIFRRRFVYIHTFFYNKIMCGCRLAICLYDIIHTSYEHRLHHSHVAPPVPISAKFIFTIDKIYLWAIQAVMLVLSRPVCLHNAAAFMYNNILLGENLYSLIRAIHVDFFVPSYYIYRILLKKYQNCKVTRTREFFASIFHFI